MRKSLVNCFVKCLRGKVEGNYVLVRCIKELVLYGSLVRGDFDPKISDVDLFYIVDDRYLQDTLESIFRNLEA